MTSNNSPQWIAQRCLWEYEKAVKRGDTRIIEILGRCLRGATFGRTPGHIPLPYVPMSNTLRLLNSVGGNK